MAPGQRIMKAVPPPNDVGTSDPLVQGPTLGYDTASTSKKKRGIALGRTLSNYLKKNPNAKPKICFNTGKLKPVGKWAKEFNSEVGRMCRTNAKLTYEYWSKVPDFEKASIHKLISSKFDIDMSDKHVKTAVDNYLRARYTSHKNRAHKHFLKDASIPYQEMDLDEWKKLCGHFRSTSFKNKSRANKDNRAKLLVNHTAGSKSFIRVLEERKKECHVDQMPNIEEEFDAELEGEPEEEPDLVSFYKLTHFREKEKTWANDHCGVLYDKMNEMVSAAEEEGIVTNSKKNEIFTLVLGPNRSGYVRGLGHGEMPCASTLRSKASDLQNANTRAEAAEKRAQGMEIDLHSLRSKMEEMKEGADSKIQTLKSTMVDLEEARDAKIQTLKSKMVDLEEARDAEIQTLKSNMVDLEEARNVEIQSLKLNQGRLESMLLKLPKQQHSQ